MLAVLIGANFLMMEHALILIVFRRIYVYDDAIGAGAIGFLTLAGLGACSPERGSERCCSPAASSRAAHSSRPWRRSISSRRRSPSCPSPWPPARSSPRCSTGPPATPWPCSPSTPSAPCRLATRHVHPDHLGHRRIHHAIRRRLLHHRGRRPLVSSTIEPRRGCTQARGATKLDPDSLSFLSIQKCPAVNRDKVPGVVTSGIDRGRRSRESESGRAAGIRSFRIIREWAVAGRPGAGERPGHRPR